jgi:hypothetical protein
MPLKKSIGFIRYSVAITIYRYGDRHIEFPSVPIFTDTPQINFICLMETVIQKYLFDVFDNIINFFHTVSLLGQNYSLHANGTGFGLVLKPGRGTYRRNRMNRQTDKKAAFRFLQTIQPPPGPKPLERLQALSRGSLLYLYDFAVFKQNSAIVYTSHLIFADIKHRVDIKQLP